MKEIIELLKKYTGHAHVELTSRGNTAIFAALYCARKLSLDNRTVLIPDQGGWLTYPQYPKKLDMKCVMIKTNAGVFDLDVLARVVDIHDTNCLLYENPAGYFAEQDIKGIFEAVDGRCKVIMDVSGCIGDDMCKGEFADIMVGSFGRWKPVNAEYGGFVSFKSVDDYEKCKEIFNTTEFDESKAEIVLEKLQNVKQRLASLYRQHEKIKDDLREHNILHVEKKGVNVVVAYSDDEEKNSLIKYCETNKYEYTECPRYIRVMQDAISIEVKRGV